MRLIATTAILLLAGTVSAQKAPARGVSVLPLGVHWTRALAFGDAFRLVLGESRVLVATDTRIEALSWDTSDVAWVADLGASVPPVAADGRVWVAADEQIHALSELTGRVEWRLPVGRVTTPIVHRAGWLLVAADDGRLRGIRAADGAVIWTSPPLTAALRLPPAIDGDRIFGIDTAGRLTAWRITDGTVLWTADASATAGGLLAAHDRVYVVADGRLTSRQQGTGRVQWSYALDMPIVSRLAADQTHVYIATLDNSVRAHRASNGHQVWKTRIDARVVDGLTADAGMVLVPHSNGLVRLMLADTGRRAGQLHAASEDARGTSELVTAGYGHTLRLARVSVTDTGRTMTTFARQTLPVTAATTLSGTPLPLTPPPGRPRP